jgi:hypothetical protein
MRARTAACTVLLALSAALAACGSSDSKADPAACKAAMEKQFKDAMAAGDKAKAQDRPDACVGVDDQTVKKYATEIMQKQLGNTLDKDLKDLQTAQP